MCRATVALVRAQPAAERTGVKRMGLSNCSISLVVPMIPSVIAHAATPAQVKPSGPSPVATHTLSWALLPM
ncbi:hypothetical protein IOK37_27315 [Escherichia coli]|nr:hypothetical protein [Escherichia coli]